jgi:hypothetical protein
MSSATPFVVQPKSMDALLLGRAPALDTGFYVAAIAGFVAFVSGFLPSGWAQRTETASNVEVDRDVYDEPRL